MEKFRLLVAGSRDFNQYRVLEQALDTVLSKIHEKYEVEIISGAARGADSLAKIYADNHDIAFKPFPADWSKGRGAGYIRNEEMHRYLSEIPHRGIIAFWDGKSKGTIHNLDLAEQYRTPMILYCYLTGDINQYKWE